MILVERGWEIEFLDQLDLLSFNDLVSRSARINALNRHEDTVNFRIAQHADGKQWEKYERGVKDSTATDAERQQQVEDDRKRLRADAGKLNRGRG